MAGKKIPAGYHTVTPYIMVRGAGELSRFMQQAFGAKDCGSMKGNDGRIMHADLQIGDSHVMIGEAMNGQTATCSLYIYVDDPDAVHKRAVQAGGKSTMAVDDQFWGDRMGSVRDPFGNEWMIATQVEEVSGDEMKRRMAAMSSQGAGAPA